MYIWDMLVKKRWYIVFSSTKASLIPTWVLDEIVCHNFNENSTGLPFFYWTIVFIQNLFEAELPCEKWQNLIYGSFWKVHQSLPMKTSYAPQEIQNKTHSVVSVSASNKL